MELLVALEDSEGGVSHLHAVELAISVTHPAEQSGQPALSAGEPSAHGDKHPANAFVHNIHYFHRCTFKGRSNYFYLLHCITERIYSEWLHLSETS